MIRRYHITSRAGVYFGRYAGASPVHAFAAMCRDAGYKARVSTRGLLKGAPGRLVFASDKDRDLCGSPDTWIIRTRLERPGRKPGSRGGRGP